MMARLVWVFVLTVLPFLSFSQDVYFPKPDYEDIKKITQDKGSAFYYGNLITRYQNNDTTLSLRDYKMLYYGYFFSPQYKPFLTTVYTDQIKQLLSKDTITVAGWAEVISLGKKNLGQNPFDLRGLNIVWVACRETGDTATSRFYFDKLKKLVQTILSTGDGLSPQTAFHILNISHEYDIINMLGYEFAGDQNLTPGHQDYLSLKPNDDNIDGLYFDVGQIFKGYDAASGPTSDHAQPIPASLGLNKQP